MGNYWAHDLPGFLSKWGVPYTTDPGWESRSRSSGGFDQLYGIGVHHTASNADVSNDVNYIWHTSDIRPIGNVLLTRDGTTIIGCAGASNTQGDGGPYSTTRGVIPANSGNRYMFSIEAQNNGVGEPWSDAIQNAYVALVCAVMEWASKSTPGAPLNFGDIIAHFQWAPGRKADPAGPSRWSPKPAGGVSEGNLWNMDLFRGDCFDLTFGKPPEPIPVPPQPQPNPPVGDTYLTNMPRLQINDQGNAVVTLQTLLIQRGIWMDKAANRDGVFGNGTDTGVRTFQSQRNITVDGIVGGETWNELGH